MPLTLVFSLDDLPQNTLCCSYAFLTSGHQLPWPLPAPRCPSAAIAQRGAEGEGAAIQIVQGGVPGQRGCSSRATAAWYRASWKPQRACVLPKGAFQTP